MTVAERLFCAPIAGLVPVSVGEANQLLVAWGHDLGPCERPFGVEAWVLDVRGRSVSVAVSASIVSDHIVGVDRDYQRGEVVELARLCSDPAERWASRPMLRLWREVAAPAWSYWSTTALVSYSTSRHTGDLYRWDGWTLAGTRSGGSGGGTWTKKRAAGHAANGAKKLWIYPRKEAVATH